MFGSEEVNIQSIIFGDRGVEISYTEPRDQSPQVQMVRTIAVDINLVEAEVEDLLDTCRQVVDRALIAVRNPEERRRPRKSLGEEPSD